MKHILSAILFLCLAHNSFAQTLSPCGTISNEQRLLSSDPSREWMRNNMNAQISKWIDQHDHPLSTTITIPVVVHVIWFNAVQNISDMQVLSEIQTLNDDFGRMNADTVNTPAAFLPEAANTGIQFCLAQQDPNGNPTTGIDRIQTTTTVFSPNDNMKHTSSGGADAWDPTRYFNFWVCNLGGGMISYSEQPIATVTPTFGVVALYSVFGSNFTAFGTFADIAPPYDHGRDVVHEVAHCFNLFHTWGDDGGACTGTDQVSDTPNEADAVIGCPSFPYYDACTTSGNGVMYSNFMDATDESCRNIFTIGQKLRMQAMLNTWPYNNLQNSIGCFAPANSPPLTMFAGPADICPGDTVSFTDMSTGGAFAWNWSFPGAIPGSSSSQNPAGIYYPSPGTYSVTLSATNTNGTSNYTSFITVHNLPATPTVIANGNVLSSSVSGISYQWFFNGVAIPGATNLNYTATQHGDYAVLVVSSFGCVSDTSVALYDPLGVSSPGSFSSVSVSPDPNDGKFTLTVESLFEDEFSVVIFNSLGQIVYEKSLGNVLGKQNLPIDLRDFGSGIYTVRLRNSKTDSVKRIIVY